MKIIDKRIDDSTGCVYYETLENGDVVITDYRNHNRDRYATKAESFFLKIETRKETATDKEGRVYRLLDGSRVLTAYEVAELLGITADYLKNGEQMPDVLVKYLVPALKRAASTPQPPPPPNRSAGDNKLFVEVLISRLVNGLCIKGEAGRPPKTISTSGMYAERLVYGEVKGQKKRWREYLVNNYGVKARTARKRISEFLKEYPERVAKGKKFVRELMKANGITSLVDPEFRTKKRQGRLKFLELLKARIKNLKEQTK